jgi:hypothetical protein
MSNDHSNPDQNKNIELTPTQLSPRDSLPTDFEIGSPTQTGQTPGHGQRGDSKAEEAKLFAEAEAFKPTQPIPVPNKSIGKR